MTTTPSTASQAPAVSISEEKRFTALTDAIYHTGFHQAGSGDREVKALADFFDAKLAQAREDRDFAIKVMAESMAMIGEVLGVDEDEGGPTAILEAIERLHAGWADQIGKTREAEVRATAAEAKLAELQMEVETMLNDAVFFMGTIELHALDGVALGERLKELLYQSQADESGLPG